MNIKRLVFGFMFSMLLAACNGRQYVQPTAQEDAATIFSDTSDVYIHTVAKDGCFMGRTAIDKEGLRVYANRDANIALERYKEGRYKDDKNRNCVFAFSFVPEKDVKYLVTSAGLIGVCWVFVGKMNDDGTLSTVPINRRTIKVGFSCIKDVFSD